MPIIMRQNEWYLGTCKSALLVTIQGDKTAKNSGKNLLSNKRQTSKACKLYGKSQRDRTLYLHIGAHMFWIQHLWIH